MHADIRSLISVIAATVKIEEMLLDRGLRFESSEVERLEDDGRVDRHYSHRLKMIQSGAYRIRLEMTYSEHDSPRIDPHEVNLELLIVEEDPEAAAKRCYQFEIGSNGSMYDVSITGDELDLVDRLKRGFVRYGITAHWGNGFGQKITEDEFWKGVRAVIDFCARAT